MNVVELKRHCRAYRDARETDHGEPWNFLVYTVGDRKFAYFKTSDPERWRFSVRVSPERFVELTDMPGVKPARWRGRYHWVTIVRVESFPEDYLADLVHDSYHRALDSLPKRRRVEMVSAWTSTTMGPSAARMSHRASHRHG